MDQAPSDAEAGTSMDVAIDSSREAFSVFGAALRPPSMTTTSTSGAAPLIDLALDDVRFTSSGSMLRKKCACFDRLD